MKSLPPTKLLRIIKDNKYPLILVLISLIICITNYKLGTFLSGWDTLHPEFNLGMYWQRITQSVWQEHQGLGAVATQAHAAEIPRMLFVWLFTTIFPLSFVRWAYFLLSLVLGPLGIYYLSKYFLSEYKNGHKYAFVGSLWYLLNLGTMQHFYVPLEMFAVLYAFIGWLFLYLSKYLRHGNKSDLVIFSLLTIFSSPMAHTSTLWFIYALFLGIFMAVVSIISWISKLGLGALRRSVVAGLLTILLNLYWLLPNLYFIFNHAEDVKNAKITRLFSEEAILHNQHYANMLDISILKAFLFDWSVHVDGLFIKIFDRWEIHLSSFLISALGLLIAIVVLYGALLTYKSKSKDLFLSFFFMILISIFFLSMDTPPFGFLYDYIQESLPLLKEALRFPFTKFSIPFMMVYAVFLSYGLLQLRSALAHLNIKVKDYIIISSLSVFIILFAFPAFSGNLIGDIDKVKIPQYYSDAYEYINKQESNSRVATLPAHYLFGWVYYDWIDNGKVDSSYQGAGFSWFLSDNPILEREFDRWYPTNEEFYNEYQYAIYSKDVELLDYLIDKYQLGFIVLDESIIAPFSERSLFYADSKDLLSKSSKVYLDKTFGKLSVYKTRSSESIGSYVYTPNSMAFTSSKYAYSNIDPNFYVSNNLGSYQTVYYGNNEGVFNSVSPLFSDDNELAHSLINSNNLTIQYMGEGTIIIPKLSKDEPIPSEISFDKSSIYVKYLYPEIKTRNGFLVYNPSQYKIIDYKGKNAVGILVDGVSLNDYGISLPVLSDKESKAIIYNKDFLYEEDLSNRIYSAVPADCGGGSGVYGKSLNRYPNMVMLEAENKNVCLRFTVDIKNEIPVVYKVQFDYKNTVGSSPMYCVHGIGIPGCLNDKYGKSPSKMTTVDGYEHYVDYFYVGDPVIANLDLILETDDKKESHNVEFKNIKLSAHSIVDVVDLTPPDEAYLKAETLKLSSSDFPLTMTLSYEGFDVSYLPGSASYNFYPRNCDNFNDGLYNRELKTFYANGMVEGIPYYEYTATDAISCDSIKPEGLNAKASYLFNFKSNNEKSKGLDICLLATNLDKCLIQDRLNNKSVNSTELKYGILNESFILPPYPLVEGMSVNLGNQSIGTVKTANKFYGLETRYIPYKWLKGIYVYNKLGDYKRQIDPTVSKKLKYMYEVMLSDNSTYPYPIVLNQSYEDGWKLFDKSTCRYGIITPYTCRMANADHFMAKNWANGWIINNGNGSYVIIFVPQYLQYWGYVSAILVLITLSLYIFTKTKKGSY